MNVMRLLVKVTWLDVVGCGVHVREEEEDTPIPPSCVRPAVVVVVRKSVRNSVYTPMMIHGGV